jgi:hypothetical protein
MNIVVDVGCRFVLAKKTIVDGNGPYICEEELGLLTMLGIL